VPRSWFDATWNPGVTESAKRFSAGLQLGGLMLVADDGRAGRSIVQVVPRAAFDAAPIPDWRGPGHRSTGIGQRLLDAAEEQVRPISRDMFLLCSDFNVGAQRFYIRQGYVQVGALPDYVVPGITELIFRKRL
jgi:GNAT superfamily N-acetyltransferase